MTDRISNIEARARALAERTLRGSFVGNPARHAEISTLCRAEGVDVPKLLDEAGLRAEVDRDWPLYAELLESGVVDG